MSGTAPGGPLDGIRVVDLTTFLSGPFCTQILADLGADVVKVESPGGDSSRHIPPHFVGDDSAYFLSHNRGKRSVVVDLKHPDGRDVVRRMVARADIVVENFRPGVAARLGLDPALLRVEHPRLVWVSISGFGQHGPWREQPAYDIVVQALSGIMSLTGLPDAPAMRLGIPAGDLVAGMYAVMAALAGIVQRERTGGGRWADVSMLDGALSMLSYQAVYSTVSGTTPRPQGSRHDSIPTYRSFVGGDGRELVVAANTQRMWVGLCEVLGRSELVEDPRFSTGRDRLQHERELAVVLEEAFASRPAEAWVAELVARSVPAAMIKSVPEAIEDARSHGRGMSLPLTSAAGEVVETIGSPLQWMDGGVATTRYPPGLGEHTRDVLDELGYTAEDVAALAERGVVTVG
ncbi:CaiB/BaiF CoA transferase family protein [Nocardioides mangrovi]|uniref:CoA transferase n=1 Tax=Nocardioides mangrovi TaxID=2874580 RepID=A0ABS7UFB6_9ACTN|nr:CoA transferase [Nocardioides mangrovi]MBZ5739544.1 CoA transferase [Nocardioides mangrovi]